MHTFPLFAHNPIVITHYDFFSCCQMLNKIQIRSLENGLLFFAFLWKFCKLCPNSLLTPSVTFFADLFSLSLILFASFFRKNFPILSEGHVSWYAEYHQRNVHYHRIFWKKGLTLIFACSGALQKVSDAFQGEFPEIGTNRQK